MTKLFKFLTSDRASFKDHNNDLNQVQVHPADPSTHQKWNITTRYYLHNFIPLIFGNKQTKVISSNPFLLKLILPVGISFYTFHGLSYIIDIYKNRIKY